MVLRLASILYILDICLAAHLFAVLFLSYYVINVYVCILFATPLPAMCDATVVTSPHTGPKLCERNTFYTGGKIQFSSSVCPHTGTNS